MGRQIINGDLEVTGLIINDSLGNNPSGSYTVDFSNSATMAEDWNGESTLTIKKILGHNISILKCSNYSEDIDLSSNSWSGDISVAPNDMITWTIERTDNSQSASICVLYNVN